jgi:hypothetical protein
MTAQQDEQRIGLAALLDDDLATAVATLDHPVGHRLGLFVGEHRKQRDAPDQIEIREHGHRGTPA